MTKNLLYFFRLRIYDMRIFIDVFSDFFLCHLKSMKILYSVTIINKEMKIDKVVIIPNLFIETKVRK